MHIILAGPRGFCAGVNMAIESLRQAIRRYGAPIYVYHEIVHNKWVVDEFHQQGVVFVNSLSEVPDGAVLLFSAHGVSPEIRRQAQSHLRTFDATCPLVTKVHDRAKDYAQEGYKVILIGHAGHDEVVGTMGEAPEAIVLVERLEDVDRLEIAPGEKLAYLTQTTLSIDDAMQIVQRLKQKYPSIVGPRREGICYATQNRQEAVGTLAGDADAVLVVGSCNSSNSQRLAELARASGKTAYLVDGPDDIDPAWFTDKETVVITAGASAPEKFVQQCVAFLQKTFHATVESRSIRQEHLSFLLPETLRDKEPSAQEHPSAWS